MKDKFKVRFHLAKGKNFMKWQITYPSGVKRYYTPSEVTLLMTNSFLRLRKGMADKIFDGTTNKEVCAWVECDSVTVKSNKSTVSNTPVPVQFNPHKNPNWLVGGKVTNNATVGQLWSNGNQLNTL